MHTILAPRLAAGDLVGIVSVSAPDAVAEPAWFERGVRSLNNSGYRTRVFPSVTKRRGYLSASEVEMARDLQDAFADTEIKAIICAGGGTNANRVLRHLDYDAMKLTPKIFMGMSNPSVVLVAIHALTGLVTFHGPAVVWNFGAPEGLSPYSAKHLWPLVCGGCPTMAPEQRRSWRWLLPGKCTGKLIGGNLTSIQGLIGTRYEPNWDGAVFFWEDIGKEMNRLDLMLTHFRDAGVFDRISGMIIGELVNCSPPQGCQDIDAMLTEVLDGYSFPVLIGPEFGHTTDKIAMPIGGTCELDSRGEALVLRGPFVE